MDRKLRASCWRCCGARARYRRLRRRRRRRWRRRRWRRSRGGRGDQGGCRHRHRRPQRPLLQRAGQQGPQATRRRARRRGAGADLEQHGDYIPNLTTLAQQQFDLIVPVGFLMADATNTVATKLPDANFAIVDFSATALKDKPKNVQGLLFKEQEAGYLAGYLAGLWAKDNDAKVGLDRRRPEDPARRPLHRRFPGGRQEGQPGDPDAQRLLPGLRRPGEVQGDRARPDREGLEGRVPGGRRLRPRRARRGQGEGRPGHRRRRRPGLPRRPHPDQRAEEGRRGRLRARSSAPRTVTSRVAPT